MSLTFVLASTSLNSMLDVWSRKQLWHDKMTDILVAPVREVACYAGDKRYIECTPKTIISICYNEPRVVKHGRRKKKKIHTLVYYSQPDRWNWEPWLLHLRSSADGLEFRLLTICRSTHSQKASSRGIPYVTSGIHHKAFLCSCLIELEFFEGPESHLPCLQVCSYPESNHPGAQRTSFDLPEKASRTG